ncbi:aminodeoxychorismate lyase [Psychrobacter frigidicola]|uniref:branched-chain-amino-acid transaminase n=1 Tax=Psychrobacter frigidicola TaxID=45611 RepID=A0A5C7A333_9GAMM|nr:aminotransferase class IV [Psychrobacter frigidicola]TXD96911.1 aminodeoxychorismate lyase [Psychrobacter frigidicola]
MNERDSWTCLQSQEPDSLESRLKGFTLDNRGLAYGDGFFTTMGVIDGAILWQDYHRQRIHSHAKALQLTLDSHALLISLQVHAQRLQQGVLKLIVTRAPQSVRGYGFTPSISGSQCEIWLKSTAMTIATTNQWHLPDGRSVAMSVPMQPAIAAVCLTAQIACLPPTLAGLKSLNRLDNVMVSGELQRLKAAQLTSGKVLGGELGEGLVRDMTGNWVEGTMSNVFYQLSPHTNYPSAPNNQELLQWFTPPLKRSGVHGVMRAVIIDAFATSATPIVERPLTDEDLPNLSQMFFCNAVRGVMPVNELTLLSGDKVYFTG